MGKHYPEEFRREAVELVRTSGKSQRQLADDLGISRETLRGWVLRVDIDEGRREGLTSAERAELNQLRRENRTLRLEREILKKAAAWFAKETDATR